MSTKQSFISKHYLPNLVIFLQSFLLLTSGQYRHRFHTLFLQIVPVTLIADNQQQYQKIPQAIIIGLSLLLMILISVDNIFVKMVGISFYCAYVCYMYNIVQYHCMEDIAGFVGQLLVIGCALVWNIDYYLEKDKMKRVEEIRRDNGNKSNISTSGVSGASGASGSVGQKNAGSVGGDVGQKKVNKKK